MAILNYTTKVKTEKTAGEIQSILGNSGASAVMSEFDNGEIVAVAFQIKMNNQVLSFRLPINHEGVLRVLKSQQIKNEFKNEKQAKRTAWRITKDWIEAQVALVEAGQAEMVEVFMPYLQDKTGTTIYNKLKNGGFKALGVDK